MHATFHNGTAETALTKDEFAAEWKANFPDSNKSAIAMFGDDQQAKAMGALKEGDVAIIDGEPGSNVKHAVTVESMDDKNVTFVDPNGMRVTVAKDQFQSHLRGATLPPDAGVQDSGADWQIGGWGGAANTGSSSGSWYASTSSFGG
jgi:hypothetical protein